ncbi:MAG TPA: hypothetical protein VKE70_27155, partial [Candidatus Solibacter sp.]|nr:hypothetical protein [Candidatus Solibacter sp.]
VRERAREIRTPDQPADLRSLLGMGAPGAPPRLETRAKTAYRNCEVLAVEANTANQVWAPAWLFLPKRTWTKMLVLIEPNGRNGAWHEDELYDRLATAGIAVCAADVRGVGDLEPQYASGSVGYARGHQSEENYAWAALILGRSLLGQRTTDIIGITQALAPAYPRASIALAARDRMTVPALCAASLEPRIAKLYLARHLGSWRSVVETPEYSCPLANMVPDALRVADLPQIARSIAPRPVTIANAWDFETLSAL